MGAVIGAALAAGVPFDEVRRRSLSLRRKDIAPFHPLALLKGMFARSLFPAAPLRRTIERLVPAKRFEHLKIPLAVTATDLDRDRKSTRLNSSHSLTSRMPSSA